MTAALDDPHVCPWHAGVQIATNVIDEGVRAGVMAAEAGADFLDLNVGCPIHEATRRGLGAALLRKPKKLARLVGGGRWHWWHVHVCRWRASPVAGVVASTAWGACGPLGVKQPTGACRLSHQ